jgi:hypothetical protein
MKKDLFSSLIFTRILAVQVKSASRKKPLEFRGCFLGGGERCMRK